MRPAGKRALSRWRRAPTSRSRHATGSARGRRSGAAAAARRARPRPLGQAARPARPRCSARLSSASTAPDPSSNCAFLRQTRSGGSRSVAALRRIHFSVVAPVLSTASGSVRRSLSVAGIDCAKSIRSRSRNGVRASRLSRHGYPVDPLQVDVVHRAERAGQLVGQRPRPVDVVVVVGVAREELVGPLARQHRLDVLARQPRGEMRRHSRAHQVHIGAFQMIDHVSSAAAMSAAGERALVVLAADMLGDPARRDQVGRCPRRRPRRSSAAAATPARPAPR